MIHPNPPKWQDVKTKRSKQRRFPAGRRERFPAGWRERFLAGWRKRFPSGSCKAKRRFFKARDGVVWLHNGSPFQTGFPRPASILAWFAVRISDNFYRKNSTAARFCSQFVEKKNAAGRSVWFFTLLVSMERPLWGAVSVFDACTAAFRLPALPRRRPLFVPCFLLLF